MTYIALAAAVVLIGIDQLTKWLAVKFIMPEGTVNLISINDKEWLNLTYQQNTGAAFSILKDKQLFLIILTSIVILGVIILMLTKRIKKTSYIWCFSLIISGGIGNLIDRIANGYVVDFIDVRIIKFAVFNFADICAVTGTILLVFFYILEEVKSSGEKKKKALAEGNTDKNETEIQDIDPNSDTEEKDEAQKTNFPIKAEIRKKEEKQKDNEQA
ncbi:MAG: signal peptidase II [Ruminococcaceae bacterium]|nr:signal peptidase II [Oscillospiraceae bacterium]